ncbi:MAG: phosphoenolpyruvate--protein phosphotransferase [Candidatus Omnitrophica bacterium]|nr:phosphoenolpyruvate--protein phosphotransferase [Candidatus Omnitrophota bacterium]
MRRDHSKLICDIGELTALFTDTANLDVLLQKIVEMTASHMDAEVCSIYLYYDDVQELVLRATKGLHVSSIGNVRLKLGEGLTGKSLLELRPVCEGDARHHPEFKSIVGIGEEKYSSFLVVPILRGIHRIGAMTLQSISKNYFTVEDVNVFRAIGSQMANTIEMAKLLMSLERSQKEEPKAVGEKPKFVRGRVGSEGVAYGEILIMAKPSWDDLLVRVGEERNYTVDDLHRAVEETDQELERMQKEIESRLFDVASLIFSAQIMMLKDQTMIGQMEALVRQGTSVPRAVQSVIRHYVERFDKMPNEFLREKKYDVIDVGRRLLDKLTGHSEDHGHMRGRVVVAQELLPSDALKLGSQGVAGIVLLSGGATSHIAVLSRSLNIPLILGDDKILLEMPEGTKILLDGNTGNVFIDPESEVVAKFREREDLRKATADVKGSMKPRTVTLDGETITLLANINLLGDVPVAKDYQAEGVGLYRTEFPFIIRNAFPSEEEQYLIYRKLVDSMPGREITFRTLDIGGDKMLAYYDYIKEANPFLGLRSIRFSLKHKDIFAQQLRAILRAGAGAEIRLMFPMVSCVDELIEAKALVVECADQLKVAKIPHQALPVIGAMIEVPSAVETIDALAREAAFFSVGTNDLIQYTLSVDRTNEKVADLYVPHHPAVLRALKKIADAARRAGCDVSVCGDMAHDVRYIPFLVGIGIRKFSLDARYLLRVQQALLTLDTRQAEALAKKAIACDSVAEAEELFIGS